MKLYNSLSKQKEDFTPYNPEEVKMYSCGFTVYDHTHIGHLKKYIGDDLLRRTLEFNGYKVKHVQNVTDVGHLVSDADDGEDKMEKGANKYGLSVTDLARKFEKEFYAALEEVNVLKPQIIERAADQNNIDAQIKLIEQLIEKDFAYVTEKGVYFDVSKLPEYNPFSNQSLEEKLEGSREDLIFDESKRNQADFALWVFRKGEHAHHIMYWGSPWGEGFPGWHIECSAISMSNLGEEIDIHTGGVDHLEIHHPNEIAQNYGVTGHQVVKYWVHHEFLNVDGKKMSKSLENFYTINDVKEKGFSPLDFRYFILGTHYRKQINFTWDALESAKAGYAKMLEYSAVFANRDLSTISSITPNNQAKNLLENFKNAVNDDINVPKALGIIHSDITNLKDDDQIAYVLNEVDKVLGLNLHEVKSSDAIKMNMEDIFGISDDEKPELAEISDDVRELIRKREVARHEKRYEDADKYREQIEKHGYEINDTEKGLEIRKA